MGKINNTQKKSNSASLTAKSQEDTVDIRVFWPCVPNPGAYGQRMIFTKLQGFSFIFVCDVGFFFSVQIYLCAYVLQEMSKPIRGSSGKYKFKKIKERKALLQR